MPTCYSVRERLLCNLSRPTFFTVCSPIAKICRRKYEASCSRPYLLCQSFRPKWAEKTKEEWWIQQGIDIMARELAKW
jgi:hypothetical protein